MRRSENTIRWFESKEYNWRLHKRFDKCRNVRVVYSEKRAGICYLSRVAYKAHRERWARLDAILNPKPVLPAHYAQWLCIHAGEGAWNSNTGNGYYGGLQMDWDFMSTYGPELLRSKGPANNWTPLEQMIVAQRAYDSGRGFYPWPNTARDCGLI